MRLNKNTFKPIFDKFNTKVDKTLCPIDLTCNLCGKEIFDGKFFCDKCESELPHISNNICQCCGRQTTISTTRCYSCSGGWSVDLARSAFNYEGGAEKLIKSLKYGNKRYLAQVLASYLRDVYIKNLFSPDIITYVPMTKKREKKRGFNQAQLLAEKLGELVDNRPIALLIKTKDTKEQKSLSAQERHDNLITCFKVIDKNLVKGKKILLVDDILTTGSTAGAISSKLKRAGAKSVYLLTVSSVQKKFDGLNFNNQIDNG